MSAFMWSSVLLAALMIVENLLITADWLFKRIFHA